jgi:hypothetical protein
VASGSETRTPPGPPRCVRPPINPATPSTSPARTEKLYVLEAAGRRQILHPQHFLAQLTFETPRFVQFDIAADHLVDHAVLRGLRDAFRWPRGVHREAP